MPIIPSQKNPLVVLRAFRDELEQRTNMTNFDRDSKIRAISDVLVDELLQDREDMTEAFYANQISNAVGDQLDQIGDRKGVGRRQPEFADVLKSESSLAFFVESGDFGSINGGGSITIPVGTIVSTEPNSNELGATIDYTVTETFVLPATSSVFFVSAQASNIGNRSNVGAEVLRRHNFTSYVDSASNTLKVINFYPVLNGRDRETDDNYRFRLAQFYNSLAQVNNAKIKLQALLVPGVIQTRVMPAYYGIGTSGVAVMGAEFQTNSRLVDGVQAHLNDIQSPGLRVQATGAVQATFDFNLEIKPSRSLSNAEITTLQAEVKRAMLDYFRRLGLGDVVNLEDLGAKIQRDTNGIVSLDSIGGRRLFKKVFVRRGLPGSTSDERQKVIGKTFLLGQDMFATLGVLNFTFF